MPAMASVPRSTVLSPERAALVAWPATWLTRCALSEIWRDVASSSVIVVLISVIAVACSFAPVACWVGRGLQLRRRALHAAHRRADLAGQRAREEERDSDRQQQR